MAFVDVEGGGDSCEAEVFGCEVEADDVIDCVKCEKPAAEGGEVFEEAGEAEVFWFGGIFFCA